MRVPEGSWIASLRTAARDIKLAHSVFAMPFAVLAGAMAIEPPIRPLRVVVQLLLIVICMVLARTWAMLFNRIVDRRFDAQNPRTATRAIASGRLALRRAWAIALASALLFWIAAGAFWALFGNPWPAILAPLVLFWIAFYSLTKRFTWLCHLFLGGALAASPLAAAIAIDPSAIVRMPAIAWLSAMVLCWVAGFDIIYALQDLDFDRSAGLHSIPARMGRRGAIWASRVLHGLALACLVLAWRADPRLHAVFGAALVLVALLLIAEHAVLVRRGDAGLNLAFFTLNGVVSVVLGVLGVADLIVAP